MNNRQRTDVEIIRNNVTRGHSDNRDVFKLLEIIDEMSPCSTDIMYISGPMTGYPNHNFEAFNTHAEWLRANQWHVINPAEIATTITKGTYAKYMRADIEGLMRATDMNVLPGWKESIGSRVEGALAAIIKIPVRPARQGTLIPRSELLRAGIDAFVELYRDALVDELNERWERELDAKE